MWSTLLDNLAVRWREWRTSGHRFWPDHLKDWKDKVV